MMEPLSISAEDMINHTFIASGNSHIENIAKGQDWITNGTAAVCAVTGRSFDWWMLKVLLHGWQLLCLMNSL